MKLGDVVLKRLNRALHRLQRQLGLRHGSLRARVRYEWGGDGAWACAKVWASLVGGNGHLLGLGCRTPLDRLDHSWDQRAAFCRRAKRRVLDKYLTARSVKPSVIVGDLRRRSSKNFWTKPPAISPLTCQRAQRAGWRPESAGCMMQALDESWAMPHAHATELSQTGAGEARHDASWNIPHAWCHSKPAGERAGGGGTNEGRKERTPKVRRTAVAQPPVDFGGRPQAAPLHSFPWFVLCRQ